MPSSTSNTTLNDEEGLRNVPMDQIKPNSHEFRDTEVVESDDFQELLLSIKIHGVLQPISLRERINGTRKYEIIDGGRRFHACELLGLKSIPSLIRKEGSTSDKQDLVWSYVHNIQRKQLNDIEKARAIKTIYENNGYSADTALQHLNNLRNNKYANQPLTVPRQFIELANSIGRANSTQWFLLKLLKDIPEQVLKYAEMSGLDRDKKQMLTYPSIKKDPQLQKAVAGMIKDLPKESARQLVHNIETGTYKFTGKGFKVLTGNSEDISAKPIEFSRDAFVGFNEVANLARKLVLQLTQVDAEDCTDQVIKNSRPERLGRLKSLSERELTIFWNTLRPLSATVGDQITLLEQEIESRKKNKKMMER
jgi:ParB/RepB/Spo0J family partition protein